MILCDRIVTRHKGKSELEITLENCKTTPVKVAELMTQYNTNLQKGKGPFQAGYVTVNRPFNDNRVFGCNHERSPYYNPAGIYFWGRIDRNNVVFELPRKNKTKEWLLDFCLNYAVTRNPI